MAKKKKKTALPFTDSPLWYKDAVIYQLHIKSYFDANNDGIGDFAGLIEKLDYIEQLGVNTIWLLPFYPSPRRDDGYDIAEYRNVHSDYGTLGDAKRFIAEAHLRGLRVITELVINHTSDQHPWFQRARRAKPGSKHRAFYVWSDSDTHYSGTRIIFTDTEKSNWAWDSEAKAYYWHRFYSHQPDLNFDNPQVLKAILSAMRYWLDLGVDGLRLDAVPYLVEREGTNNENLPETHAVLRRIRAEIDTHYPDRMLLAEANQWPEDVQQYFGSGDECHMAFHFPLMPRMYMAIAQEDRFPITDILRQTPDIPPACQWAIFLRNHDELTLEMVTDRERDYLWDKYASDGRARLNLGIRRRLSPLVERDRRRLELLNSLLLSLPGTPVIYYGDEIGMGDNIHLGDRDGVRTPMQWSSDRNGGFSRADPATLVLPPIMDPLYGFGAINVEAQSRDPHSFLNWMRRMLSIRKQQHIFGRGSLKILYPPNRRILAYLREGDSDSGVHETILCVANVSRYAEAVELELSAFDGRVPVEMLGGSAFPPIGQLPYLLTLPPYGFYWFLLAGHERMPAWHLRPPETMTDHVTLVLRRSLSELLAPPSVDVLQRDILPAYLPKRRWFAAKDGKLDSSRIVDVVTIPGTTAEAVTLLTEIETVTERGSSRYLLPLGFLPEESTGPALAQQLALARVRQGRRVGYLTDAFSLDGFACQMLKRLRLGQPIATAEGELQFLPTPRLAQIELSANPEIRRLAAEQSNSSLIAGDRIMIKLIRRVAGGLHPEAEMNRLLAQRGFANIAPPLGEVVHVKKGLPHVLMVVQEFIHNQGDAWSWTQNMLERAIKDASLTPQGGPAEASKDAGVEFAQFAHVLGKRIGEMHRALAQDSTDPALAPGTATPEHAAQWSRSIQARLGEACDLLSRSLAQFTAEDRKLAEHVLTEQANLRARIQRLGNQAPGSLLTRVHGDLHLGQILVAQEDAYIIDFEGEPARSLEQRRAKTSPLRDVAGMLRSFDYAAAMIESASGAQTDTRQQEILTRYRDISTRAFLTAYHAASGVVHTAQTQALIELFLLEKAAYEIAYEAANRPTWLPVPLRGLALIASTASGAAL